MKPEWQSFLQNAGAEIENNTVLSFGNLEREQRVVHTGLVISDLSHFGLIAAYGGVLGVVCYLFCLGLSG